VGAAKCIVPLECSWELPFITHRIGTRVTMRPDIVVYDVQFRVEGILECKAPFVVLDQHVLDQIGRYNRLMGAKWLGLSNGLHHTFYRESGGWQEMWPNEMVK
jgi:hypothetical protein